MALSNNANQDQYIDALYTIIDEITSSNHHTTGLPNLKLTLYALESTPDWEMKLTYLILLCIIPMQNTSIL